MSDVCRKCAHYRETSVFELCTHPESDYHVAGEHDWHTVGHMRTRGACMEAALLFKPCEATQ